MGGKGSDIAVRTAGPSDADLIFAIGANSFTAAYGETTDAESIARHVAATFGTAAVRSAMTSDACHYKLALADGTAAGFAKLCSDKLPDALRPRKALEVRQLYVHSAWQGSGVGRRLLDHAVGAARERGFDSLWLQTWSEADWAIRFYRRYGFERCGSLPYYLGEQRYDDWLMLYRVS